jgi:hypothetical protein
VGDSVVVLLVVVPPEAQALKDKLDQQVAEWQAAGAAKMDDLIRQMQQELAAWAQQEAEKQAAKCVGVNGGLMIGVIMVVGWQRGRKNQSTDAQFQRDGTDDSAERTKISRKAAKSLRRILRVRFRY